MEGHREGHVIDLGQHRPEAGLVGLHLTGQAHACEGAAVETAGECDYGRALGVVPSDLDRVLHRLGAG